MSEIVFDRAGERRGINSTAQEQISAIAGGRHGYLRLQEENRFSEKWSAIFETRVEKDEIQQTLRRSDFTHQRDSLTTVGDLSTDHPKVELQNIKRKRLKRLRNANSLLRDKRP